MSAANPSAPRHRTLDRALRPGAPRPHAAKGRRRCTPPTAYAANGVVNVGQDNIPRAAVLPPKAPAVFVECTLHDWEPVLRVDHHHPGDPGWDAGPQEYLRGSSPFMAEHRDAGRPVYGNPYRGYAGAYWPGRSAPGTPHRGGPI